MHGQPFRQQRLHRRQERGQITLQIRTEAQLLACRQDRHPVASQIATHQDRVTELNRRWADGGTRPQAAHGAGGDENAIPLAPLHHLGVAGHHRNAALRSHCADGSHYVPKHGHRQAFLQDQSQAEGQGACAHHRQVVDGADHRQPANVAARENQGPHHIRVGGEGQCPRPSSKRGSIVKDPIGGTEGRHKQLLNQPLAEAAAATMAQLNPFGGI